METKRPALSLRWKIICLVTATALLVALIISAMNYLRIQQIAMEKAVEQLAGVTRLSAQRVRSAYLEMKEHAAHLHGTPPMQGIIRAQRNGGIDPLDGSTETIWRQRAAQIFTSMLQSYPTYTQIRLIGIADYGRELVRVDREEDSELKVVARKDLQQKAHRPYFKKGLKLRPGQFAYSDVTYNREFRRLDPRLTPTLRIIYPVYDDTNSLFGMIVINADYEKFLRNLLDRMNVEQEVYVADSSGAYMYMDTEGRIYSPEIPESYAPGLPNFILTTMAGHQSGGVFTTGDLIGYFQSQIIPNSLEHRKVGTFLLMPKDKLLAETHSFMSRNLMISGFLVVASALIAAFFGHMLTRPMARMRQRIQAFNDGTSHTLDLPVQANDEVGDMARSFSNLLDKLQAANIQRARLFTQFDAFIKNSVDGVILADENGIIEQVNPACLSMFGYQENELIGRNLSVLMPDGIQNRYGDHAQTTTKPDKPSYIGTVQEQEGRKADGTLFPISLSVSEMKLPNHRSLGVIIRDVSAIRDVQKALQRYTTELERSNFELDQFAYVASHDLKAPLRVIDNASRWLEEDLQDKLTDEDRENMELLRNRVKRMEKLLDDLLEYSRIGRTADDRYRELLDAKTLINDILMLLVPPPGMAVRIPEALEEITVHRMPLQLVFHNLINNALKHHDRKEGVIEISVEDGDDRYLFTVRDDGPGIPPKFRDKVFEMFHTLKPRDQVEGSGMGLAMVKKTIEQYGGTVNVQEAEGRGAAITFSWPKHQQDYLKSNKAA